SRRSTSSLPSSGTVTVISPAMPSGVAAVRRYSPPPGSGTRKRPSPSVSPRPRAMRAAAFSRSLSTASKVARAAGSALTAASGRRAEVGARRLPFAHGDRVVRPLARVALRAQRHGIAPRWKQVAPEAPRGVGPDGLQDAALGDSDEELRPGDRLAGGIADAA